MISQEEIPSHNTTAIPIDTDPVEVLAEASALQEMAVVDYTQPLDPALLAIVTKEFDAFVQEPKAGWDLTYPVLYKTLLGIVTDICTDMHAPVPALVIEYIGTNALQALVNHMTDGTKRLHLGTEFIRTQLLDPSPENALLRHRAFRWTLAHEIGHILDPKMNWWGNVRVYQVRMILQKVTRIFIMMGIYNAVFCHIPMLQQYFSGKQAIVFIAVGYAIKAIYLLVETCLHHHFEYAADCLSFNAADHFTIAEPVFALTGMNIAIAQEVVKQEHDAKNALIASSKASWLLRVILPLQLVLLAVKQRYARFNLLRLHPSVENRIIAMNKQFISAQK